MRPNPAVVRQPGLQTEQEQARNPGNRGEQQSQHGEFSKNIISPAEGAAQKKREGAVGQIAADEDGPDPAVQKKSRFCLHDHNDDEVLVLYLEKISCFGAYLHQQLQSLVIRDEDVARREQAWNDTKYQEKNEEPRFKQIGEGKARQNKKT